MGEKSPAFGEKLKHKGFFNFSELYSFCYMWFKDEGYTVFENEYSEKLTAGGKEVVIKWDAKKKITDYFRNIIEVRWRIIGLQDAEIEIDGKKIKTNKGDLTMEIKGDLERDWEEKWEKNPTYKFFRSVYDNYITRSTRETYEDRLTAKAVSYTENVKAFLNLEGKR
jgi:hypothetical protein